MHSKSVTFPVLSLSTLDIYEKVQRLADHITQNDSEQQLTSYLEHWTSHRIGLNYILMIKLKTSVLQSSS